MAKEGEGMLVRECASKVLCKDKGDELKENKTWRNYGGAIYIDKSTETLADFDARRNMGIGFDARFPSNRWLGGVFHLMAEFCGALKHLFKGISRNTVKDDIVRMYNEEKLKTVTFISKNQNFASIIYFGETNVSMRCCAHILNLVVKDGLSIFSSTIERVTDIVSFWTATPKREENFEETCEQLNIRYDKKLKLDCKTRWNSTFLMLHAAPIYRDVFQRLSL
ncbi:hypothetical protein Lal_00039253 [Lupinus albus]|nr:hypothetical protein Lal_00039253 [Lupinus albus]